MRGPGGALHLGQVTHVSNKAQPASMAGTPGVEAGMLHFRGARPCAVALAEVTVERGELFSVARLADQGSQDVENLQIIGHLAARGEFDQLILESLKCYPQCAVACVRLKQRAHLGQEGAMIADIINDGEMGLVGGSAQASAQLLQPDHGAFGRAQHEHRVDRGHINAFVEHIDREDDIEVAVFEGLQRAGPGGGGVARVDRYRAQAA